MTPRFPGPSPDQFLWVFGTIQKKTNNLFIYLFTFGRFAFRLIFFGLICNILNITKISVIRLRSKSTRGWSKQDQKYFLYFLFFFFCIFLVSTVKFSVVGRKAEFTPVTGCTPEFSSEIYERNYVTESSAKFRNFSKISQNVKKQCKQYFRPRARKIDVLAIWENIFIQKIFVILQILLDLKKDEKNSKIWENISK